MKISEILHIAADAYLWEGVDWFCVGKRYNRYSCVAVRVACFDYGFDFIIVEKGLQEMGVNPYSSCEFDEFKTDKERQTARYLWLKWAAMMAEEQGV